MLYRVARSFLFLYDAERAHYIAVFFIKAIYKFSFLRIQKEDPRLQRTLFGLNFKNPIGLAAGFDKNASCFKEMEKLGFGFVEIGTVTPESQEGNPKPRLFRLKTDRAIINRMGFNNDGSLEVVKRLKNRKDGDNLIVGGNIGKNKWTPNEKAVEDYLRVFKELYPYVDYFAVNVSSPNTENLRTLQDKLPLTNLLKSIKVLNEKLGTPKPILLKIAPDLTNSQLNDIIEIALELSLDGIIATNTTISREGLNTSKKNIDAMGAGGLSGKPLTKRSTDVIRYLHQGLQGKIPIIGVGGIHSKEDAMEKLNAGASLIQLYTGFIYEGPKLINDIKKELLNAS